MNIYELLSKYNNKILCKNDDVESNTNQYIVDSSVEVKNISFDSREVDMYTAFVAIKGFKQDGHDYIESAIEKKAPLIICNYLDDKLIGKGNFLKVDDSRKALADLTGIIYNNPSEKFDLIGVTGTNGKTSITYLIKQILEYSEKKIALIGTLGTVIGEEKLHTLNTTPESNIIAKNMVIMNERNTDACIMEVSSHSTELFRIRGLDFDYAIFTNLTKDHLNFHKTMENYYQAKKKLFIMGEKISAINTDDDYGKRLYKELLEDGIKTVSYGIKSDADYRARNVITTINGSEFDLTIAREEKHIVVKTPGDFSILNSLAAIIISLEMGIGVDLILEALKNYGGVPGRFEILPTKLNCTVIVDFAHTPDGFEKICDTIDKFADGRKIALYGGQGERDHNRRGPMGEIAAKHNFISVITTDNPVYENPEDICKEIANGVKKQGGEYKIILDREKAINYCIKNHESGDVILFAGKSTEPYQMIEDRKEFWDEKLVVQKAIKKVENIKQI